MPDHKKPNIIVIYCDDLGYGDLGCYGSETCLTPHLDALATDGIRFTDWYSNSPVCSPSRASLLTGKYPANAGVSQIIGGRRGTAGLPSNEMTLAKALGLNGYRTALFGKWHLGTAADNSPNAHGFDEFFGFKAGCIDFYSHIFYWEQGNGVNPVHDLWRNEQEVWENGKYMTEIITEKAIDFIDKPGEEPFFLYAAYNAPHYPMHAPKSYMDRFSHLPWDRQVMAAMIAAVDDGVGEIVQRLKKNQQYENTVIFFSSDNGPSTESRNWLDGKEDLYYGGSAGQFRGHKASLFEGGIREPAILTYPARLPKGDVNRQVFAMMDIFPTFLRFANAELISTSIDGIDVSRKLSGSEDPQEDRTLFWEYGEQLAVRKGDWKLVIHGKLDFSRKAADPIHLSNLAVDPGECNNVAGEHPEVVKELTEAVRAWADRWKGAGAE
jgi:arylsulfatase A-like enzyme